MRKIYKTSNIHRHCRNATESELMVASLQDKAGISVGQAMPDNSKKSAFSLVEMLMALLVASLLMAALAPVMTKKINENVIVSGTGGAILPKTYCAYVNDSNELLRKVTEADACIVPDNTYAMGIILASGGGGGGGAADMASSSSLKNLTNASGVAGASNSASYTESVQTFDKSTKNILIKIAGGGAGAGGGNYVASGVAAPKSQADCEPFGIYIKAAWNGGKDVCVSKYNPGETHTEKGASPSTSITGVTTVPAGTNCSGNYCCWTGNQSSSLFTAKDSGSYACDSAGGSYSGCYRTVCKWNAANIICQNWKPTGGTAGRLPTLNELSAWATYINNISTGKGDSGLQLCGDRANTGTGASQCDDTSKCPGSDCIPEILHGDSSSNSYFLGVPGSFNKTSCGSGACSTRCVLEETQSFTPYLGGGGGSGSYLELNVPTSVISKATENGNAKIRVLAGAGGKGSPKETASQKGVNGSPSYVEIYDGSTILWKLGVPGGNAGTGASKSAGGTNGLAVTEKCTYYDSTNDAYKVESQIECNLIPGLTSHVAGKAGNSGNSTLDTAGKGGASAWVASGTPTIGKGGDGATCTQGTSATDAVCSEGGAGQGGRVEAWHSPTYPGVGGGGGAAGTVLHISNIQVRPKDLIKVQVGHGGAGGSVNAKGTDGGSSYVEIVRGEAVVAKYEVLGGGGGLPGVSGDPDTAKTPQIGTGGAPSKIASGTKTTGGEFFPKNADDTAGENAVASTDETTSIGGNGGVNEKISPLVTTDGVASGIPCGGMNTGEIKVNKETTWQCANSGSNVPFALSRALSDSVFSSSILESFAPGGTGGGGGGWKYSATPRASGGAKGLGGYAYIYFGDWGGSE